MAAAFTEKESRLVKAALESVEGGDAALMKLINFEEVYGQCEYKNAANAKEMFRRLMIKLKGGHHRAPKTSDAAAKPQGVGKPKAKKGDGVASKPGRRGRQKKNVVEEAAPESDPAGEEDQVNDANNDSDSNATIKEDKSEDSDEKPVFKEEDV